MTLDEQITALQAACKKVYTPAVQEPSDPLLWSILTDQVTGLQTIDGSKRVAFKVYDKGTDDEEAVVLSGWPQLPMDKNLAGMQYLAGQTLTGKIAGFEVEKIRADLGIFSFFIVKVEVPTGEVSTMPAEVRTERWRIQEGPEGQVFHMVIV